MPELELPQLCPDERPWRIDWLGQLDYPGVVKRFRQPCVSVSISPVTDNDHTFCTSEQREVWVALGAIPMIEVGQIWQAGRLTKQPVPELVTFRLAIRRDTTKLVKAGLELDGRFLLPFDQHPWHKHHTNAYCLVVRADEHQQIVIPCMELIRFYFGSSSNVLHKLFTQPFTEELLWSKKHFDAANGHLHLKLTGGIPGDAAPDVGRIAMDPVAQRAAGLLYASCASAKSANQAAYPKTHFPFEGVTWLQATGTWIANQDGDQGLFVVSAIRSCSHPFPFSSLTYEKASTTKVTGNGAGGQNQEAVANEAGRSKRMTVVNEDPGQAKQPKKVFAERKVRFPDLLGKRVWLNRIEVEIAPEVLLTGKTKETEPVAFGLPEGNGEARAIDTVGTRFAQPAKDSTPTLPKFAEIGIRHFRQQINLDHAFEFLPLVDSQTGEYAFELPLPVDEDGVIDEQTRFTEPDGTHRQRRVCLFGMYKRATQVHVIAVYEAKDVSHYPFAYGVGGSDAATLLEGLSKEG